MGRSRDLADGTLAELNVDSNTLAVDATNDRVGIGTSSPSSKLEVAGGADSTIRNTASSGSSWFAGTNTSSYILHNASNTPMVFTTNSTERMRIDSSGNVGIGTSSPTTYGDGNTKFAVVSNTSGTADVNIRWGTNAVKGILYCNDVSGAGLGIGSTTNTYFAINTNNAERMRIDSNGVVFVGTTSSPSSSNKGWAVQNNGTNGKFVGSATSVTTNYSHYEFYNPNGTVGSITTNGSSTSYNTSSDYRLKEDMQPMSGSIERVKALKPVNFAWKVDGSRVDGFLAHEAQEVVPEAISGTKDAMRTEDVYDEDGNVTGTQEVPDYQGIDQSKLVPLLTAALQEAITKIETLEARLDAAGL